MEVDHSSSIKEIKSQYRKMAKIWHPDKNPNCGEPCNVKFNKITEAYKILSNP